MFARLIPAALTALALGLPASAETHVSADTVVARVGGTEITLAHMMVLKQRLPQQYRNLPPDILFEGILDQLIQQTLLGDTVDGLSKGGAAVLDNERRALFASEAIRRITDSAATDEAIQAAYDETYAETGGETEYDVSHILFMLEEDADDAAVAEALAKAEAALAELSAGADFAELARERSEGPSGPNGGALGWYGPEALVPEFSSAMMAMEPGEISEEPVRTQFGFHVIRLNDTRLTEAPPLEEVRAEIVDRIRREAIEAEISKLTEAAEVERMTDGVDPSILDDASLLAD